MIVPPTRRSRARHHPAQLERRHAFLLHQCARHGLGRADARASTSLAREYPRAAWIVALHHHVMEYPWAAKQLSMRIGTALINGNWFVRSLKPLTGRAVLMHGHRHVDWIGQCAGLPIISAPSPVMEVDRRQGYRLLYPHAGDRRRRQAQPAHARAHRSRPARPTVNAIHNQPPRSTSRRKVKITSVSLLLENKTKLEKKFFFFFFSEKKKKKKKKKNAHRMPPRRGAAAPPNKCC